MARSRDWRIHIGVHKTATTHLQQVLQRVSEQQAARGTRIIPHDHAIAATRVAAGRKRGIRDVRRTARLVLHHVPLLQAQIAGAQRVVLSSEDVLGWATGLLEAPFYPSLRGLDLFRYFPGIGTPKIYIGVRSYEALLVSSYFEILRTRMIPADAVRQSAEKILEGQSGWPNLLDRIQARLPGAQIHFWAFEDYRDDGLSILRAFLGDPEVEMPSIDAADSRVSPGMAAIDAVGKLDPSLPLKAWRREVEQIYADNPRQDGEVLTLIPGSVREALQARYLDDLSQLDGTFTRLR
ncbi:MAG: hypothetical protein AAFS07_03110 [Pseudomonadota bacterium]